MTLEEQALLEVVRRLDALRVPYMVAGSVASSYYGRPRSTHDADVVIDPTRESLERLVVQLASAGFHVDAERARDALLRRRMFNVIEPQTACKIDLIVRKERPFSREEFQRRRLVTLSDDVRLTLASPEDVVLSKLEWARRSGECEKQLSDVAGILQVRHDLDRAYIERWATTLGVSDLWERATAVR